MQVHVADDMTTLVNPKPNVISLGFQISQLIFHELTSFWQCLLDP